MEKIVPFLWFDDQAEEAANFYVSVFSKRPGAGTSRVRNITHYGEAGPRPAGMVMTVDFELEGHGITALNGGPEFSFTEALSLAVNCESQKEVDYLWTALSESGEEGPCGWLKDRYGLSWQIMPVRLTELLNDPDEAAAQRVMSAMLQMTKIDIAELERAYAAGAQRFWAIAPPRTKRRPGGSLHHVCRSTAISPRAPVRRGSHRVPGPPTPRPTETPPATT